MLYAVRRKLAERIVALGGGQPPGQAALGADAARMLAGGCNAVPAPPPASLACLLVFVAILRRRS